MEALWLRIVGVLLILLGIVLLVSPVVSYTRRETVMHTPSADVTAKRRKGFVVPRPVAVIVIGAGVGALIFAGRKPRA